MMGTTAPSPPRTPTWHDHKIVVFDGVNDRTPKPMRLFDLFSMEPQAVDKTSAKAFIPSSFAGPQSRKKEAQEEHGSFGMLVVDQDGGLGGEKEAQKLVWRAMNEFTAGAAWGAYTTYSAAPGDLRLRIIVPLAEPVSFDDWRAAQEMLCSHLAAAGVPVDDCSKKASQLMFAPNRPASGYFKRKRPDENAEAIRLNDPVFASRMADARQRLVSANVKERSAASAKVAETDSAYGLRVLESQCDRVRNTSPSRNGEPGQEQALNDAAFNIGKLVGGGELTLETAYEALLGAGLDMDADQGKGAWTVEEIEAKIEHGLSDGAKQPLSEESDLAARLAEALDDFAGINIDALAELPENEEVPTVELPVISATPYRCREPAKMPRRKWVYGRQLLRGSLSVIVAPGAVGKTALSVGMGLALAAGRSILGKDVWEGAKRVWLWNLEDSELELSYLIEAARKHWGLSETDLGGRLFVDSALSGAELCVATEDRNGFKIMGPVVEALVAELRARKIDVLVVDPFVSSHRVSENNNTAVDAVAKTWARVAVEADCAILLVHHTRKLNGVEATAESGRGAVALPNAARSVLALNKMTAHEAATLGVEEEHRRRLFRAYDDKANRAPPAAASDWYFLDSTDLGNDANGHGDSIQVVVPWTPPNVLTGITPGDLRLVQERIAAGDWRQNVQAKNWAGRAIAEVLDLDLDDEPAKARVKELLKIWAAAGWLKIEMVKNKYGRGQPFVRVGQWDELVEQTP